MDDDIQLVADENGISLIGKNDAIDSLLSSLNLPSVPMELDRLTPVVAASGAALQIGSEIAANSGRWVKLTKESAEVFKVSQMMSGSSGNVVRAVSVNKGKISGILEIIKPGKLLTNPAVLTGVGGLMAQYAMQQTMQEITDYLKRIEDKLGDVVHALKDAQIAPMLAAGDTIEDVMAVRDSVGRVSATSWSKVQGATAKLATAQNYALLQLEGLIKKLAKEKNLGDAASLASKLEPDVTEWLVVIARSLRLQDAVDIFELERVLDVEPEDLERHRLGLRTARMRRFAKVENAMGSFAAQLTEKAEWANKEIFLHPIKTPQLVSSAQNISRTVSEFQHLIGVEVNNGVVDVRPWKEGAIEARDGAIELAVEVADKAKKIADVAAEKAKDLAVDAASQAALNAEKLAKKVRNLFARNDKE